MTFILAIAGLCLALGAVSTAYVLWAYDEIERIYGGL